MKSHLSVDMSFEAAHSLPKTPDGHKCRRLHGHSFKITLQIDGEVDSQTGWVMDYADIRAAYKPLHNTLDHRHLNEIPGLENPTSEILAAYIYDHLKPSLPLLSQVTVHETCNARCSYSGE